MNKIIVTGAAGGIGKAIVQRLTAEGVGVIACDKDAAGLKSLAKKTKVQTETFDVTDRKAIQKFTTSLNKTEVSGLVNNAGIYLGRDLFDYTADEMDLMLSVNLFPAILLSQWFGKRLVKQKTRGAIVNTASISAFEGSSDALYGTSKAALVGFTRCCALTFAPWVRVNAVSPGIVDTPLIKAIPKWRLVEFEKGERLQKRITPDVVASAVWFLLSEESRHTTGSVLDINNGGYFR